MEIPVGGRGVEGKLGVNFIHCQRMIGGKCPRGSRIGQGDGEREGVQSVPPNAMGNLPVQLVARNGMTEVRKMYAQLMAVAASQKKEGAA